MENDYLSKLKALADPGKIPIKTYKCDTPLYRWQSENQAEGFYYNKPQKLEEMGRYNDPAGKVGVCYVATDPITAMAESYCRQNRKFVEVDELTRNQLCELEITDDINTLDIGAVLPKIGLTLDELTSSDYTKTQAICGFFANNPQYGIQGMSYRSRHYDNGGYCVALLEQAHEPEPLKTNKMTAMEDYHYDDHQLEGWEDDTIDGEEILTEVLGINVL